MASSQTDSALKFEGGSVSSVFKNNIIISSAEMNQIINFDRSTIVDNVFIYREEKDFVLQSSLSLTNFSNNVFYSTRINLQDLTCSQCQINLIVFGSKRGLYLTTYPSITLPQNWFTCVLAIQGIEAKFTLTDWKLSGVRIYDTLTGITIRNEVEGNALIQLKNSKIVGRSGRYLTSLQNCNEQVGVILHNSTDLKQNAQLLAKFEVSDVEFANFYQNGCGNSFVFKVSKTSLEGFDFLSLNRVSATNCSSESKIGFEPIQPSGNKCGSISCTGIINRIARDFDGVYSSGPHDIIYYNPDYLKYGCNPLGTLGLACPLNSFASLVFETTSSDRLTSKIFPISITNTNNGAQKQVSSFSLHALANNRLGVGQAVLPINEKYILRFADSLPYNIRIQMLNGQDTSYYDLVFNLSSNRPYQVTNNGVPVLTLPINSTQGFDFRADHTCGANFFDDSTNTVYIRVTGKNCVLDLKVHEAVKAQARYNVPLTDFWSYNGVLAFQDKIAAVLKIPLNRLVIFRIYEGSTVIDFGIMSENPIERSEDTSTNITIQQDDTLKELGVIKSTLLSSNMDINIAKLLEFTVRTTYDTSYTYYSTVPFTNFLADLTLKIVLPITLVIAIVFLAIIVRKFRRFNGLMSYN